MLLTKVHYRLSKALTYEEEIDIRHAVVIEHWHFNLPSQSFY